MFLFTLCIKPLLPNGNYGYRIIKISFSKKEGIKKKISYDAVLIGNFFLVPSFFENEILIIR